MNIKNEYLPSRHNIKNPRRLIYQRMIVSRIYVAFSILFSTLAFAFEPLSKQGSSAIATNAPIFWIYAALVLCLMAVIDIIINDLAPDNFKLNITYNYRHIIYMLLAVLSFSISVAVANTYGTSFLICRLWLDGGVAAVVAFLDIFGRYRGFRDTTIHIHSN